MRGMTTKFTVGERIAWYRKRRGISQEVLAGLVGRTADWLSKIENGHLELDRLSVLTNLADALDIGLGDLLGEPSLMEWTHDSGQHTVPALRSVLMDYRQITGQPSPEFDGAPLAFDALRDQVASVWTAYQESRFGFATRTLVDLFPQAKYALDLYAGDDQRVVAGRLALIHQVAASILTKLGEADLAWTASDRGVALANQSENPAIIGSLLRSVSHSLLSIGAYDESVKLTNDTAVFLQPHIRNAGPSLLSVYGTGLLVGAMAAARNDDRRTAHDYLDGAEAAADRLGRDDNKFWTAFGPTNVAIHRVSTAMELGDVQIAMNIGPDLDTSAVPTERRVRHSLEVARALSASNQRDEAVATVLEAEQTAPEQVRYHFLSRHLVQTWIRTQKGKPSYQLTELAQRLHVA